MKSNILCITAYSFLTMGLLGGLSAKAQEAKTLTLKDAIDLSIKNSKQLKISKARVDEAIADTKEANDKRLPDFSVTGAALFLPFQPDISIAKSSSSSSSGGSSTPTINQAYYGIATVSLPLYTAGKLKYGIESANYLEKAAMLDVDHDQGGVIFNTINAYANLYKAKLTVMLIQQNLTESQQRVKDFSNLEKNGIAAKNDLLKVELQSSNVELLLADAQTNWNLACINMDIMLGLPEQTQLAPDSTDLLETTDVKTFDDYEQAALQNRKDMLALSYRKKAAGVAIKVAKANYYPSLALTGGYIALDVPKFISVTNAVNIGVGVNYSLSSLWKNKTKVQQAEAKVEELQADEDMLDDNIRLMINQDYQNYLLSQKKISVYQVAIEQATENYRITKNKYDNALETTTDLLDADVASLQAQLNYYNAKVDALIAYKKLLQTAGLLNNQ
jgi:outer membrane protein